MTADEINDFKMIDVPRINNYIREKGARNRPIKELQWDFYRIGTNVLCRNKHVFAMIENGMGGPVLALNNP